MTEMKRALVTGGSGHIGTAIATELAGAGLHVIVHGNSRPQRAEATAGAIRDAGGSAEAVCFDVADAEAAGAALGELLQGGPIQVVVNNAGLHLDAPMAGMSQEQWHRVLDASLNGFFNVTQPLLLPMARTRWGRVINVSSVSGIMGNRGQANYAAAKAGLHGASKSLARELASRGITVNVVAPGLIETEMSEGTFTPEQVKGMVPMQRAGSPEEVAALVGFLASDRASYISGQVIAIDGAMTCAG